MVSLAALALDVFWAWAFNFQHLPPYNLVLMSATGACVVVSFAWMLDRPLLAVGNPPELETQIKNRLRFWQWMMAPPAVVFFGTVIAHSFL